MYSAFQAHSPLTAIVGTACYPVLAPQDATLPFVTWQEITFIPTPTHDTIGKEGFRFVQISCWAATIAAARTLRGAAIDAIFATETKANLETSDALYQDPDFDSHNPHYNAQFDIELWDTTS